ncbi:RHS repeat-associated core domain-containing protein [Streptomyces anulatus]|uniref:RHS repeat-associated core domain-containing protein n=1 Tax=Streptomyces anulatus TaxID=1892 RepID=UPI0027E3393B|nr:RHS repeat-associated core domain-containing protein [Streptomyces anulatus]
MPLVGNVTYDALSRPVRTELGALGRKVYDTRVIDEHTGSLVRRTLDGDQALRIEDTRYSYDDAGNTRRISSTSGQDSPATTDTQCFALDALRRMTEAWTTKSASDDCASGPSATTVGGPDSYWHSYTYDVAGNRAKEVRHATASGISDITRTYTPGKAGEANPHVLRSITTTGGPDDGGRENFTYDKVGNTASRSGGARGQGYVWDAEGNLAEITENGKSTAYLYDSSGNRLLARNADATTTAYLPGGNQLTVTASGAKTATRYYTHGGETVAVRGSTGISFVFADHQGTGLTAVGFTEGQAVTRRKQLPFGEGRGVTGTTWPGDRGFVGGTTDPTGLTHLGAREYDPALGRFLSVDPLILPGDSTQLNPYVYGNNNAATFSDPTGEAYEECVSGQYKCTYGKGGTGDLKKVEFGKNYKKVTKSVGGTISPNYTIQQNTGYKHVYTKGSGVTAPTAAQRAASAEIERQKRIERERKAAEAQQKKNKEDEGFWSGLKQWGSDNWDGIKTGLTVVAFGACIVASAGACIAVGAAVATAKFLGDGKKTGNYDLRAYSKDLAWTAVGGGSAAAFGRAFGGAKNWRQAYWGSPWAKHTAMTKIRPATSTRPAVMRPTSRIDKGATYGNMSVNAGFNAGFCGANTASVGSYPGNIGGSLGLYSGAC